MWNLCLLLMRVLQQPQWTRLLRRVAVLNALPGLSLACACGCGVFDVGTSSMYASHAGGMAYVEYDYLDQSQNRSGTASAPTADNPDKSIRSRFFTIGGHYLFNRRWGVALEAPYWQRDFNTTDDSGNPVSASHGAVGDLRIKGLYTGFSEDMSSGLSFGLKLANGDSQYPGFDPDTEIGTGSTDVLLGIYHLGRLSADNRWSYFLQAQGDAPVAHKDYYRPGAELVATAGMYYEGWQRGSLRLSPVAQLRGIVRRADSGARSLPNDTGYTRLLFAPGVELGAGSLRLYADVGLPIYTNARGNQLFATALWKLNVSHSL